MSSDPLLERLQRAVSPDYRVERVLGGGGMGRVYLAHEVVLNRDVAIKVLRPELATADGAEAFLREAQILASVRHPNVIVIYRADEGEGLQYYIMELVSGPTLEDRIASGPIPAKDVVRIGINLVDGLETVHRIGLVHRDVKPSNVFLLPKRAVLGDFGIARPPSHEDSDSHSRECTPEYMAPEQVEGKPITPLTDIYSTGVVLYEAVSGRRFHEQGQRVDWSGIPHDLERVMRRAVATRPEDRWTDAAAFRQALERTMTPGIWRPVALVGAGGLLIGALVLFIVNRVNHVTQSANRDAPNVTLDQIDYVGPSDRRPIADSLVRLVHSDLRTHINFVEPTTPSLVVQARMTVTGDDVRLQVTGNPPSEFHVPLDGWPTLRDSLSYQVLLGVWNDRSSLAPSLPSSALPRTSEGLARFLEAEQLVSEAEWQKAYEAYQRAVATDASCWICLWRMTEVARWLFLEPDADRERVILAHARSLPPRFASLIRAARLPLRQRLDTLGAVTKRSPEFFLGWFQLGDELFHRGPLVGHRRSEAIPAFERAARLRPDFGPAWEHLAWVATAEGDSSIAADALDSLETHGVAPDAYSLVLRALLRLGFAWRFTPEDAAQRVTAQIASAPEARSSPNLGAGPRLLPTFDVPRGAIALGAILEKNSSRELRRSGLIAQTLGALALGRIDDTRDFAQKLRDVTPETELDVFTAELEAALALLDDGGASATDALEGLRPWIGQHDQATWMSALLDRRVHLRADAPREFHLLVSAESLARIGRPRAALARLDSVPVDAVARHVDPFYRTIVHLWRADWLTKTGDIEAARSELTWHEHLELVGLPTGMPQAADVDWAFGTLARWRLARLLDRPGSHARGEACKAYAAVIRNWSGAPVPYGARADTAQQRARELNCAARTAR